MGRPATKVTAKSAKGTAASGVAGHGFTDGERAAMKARAQELKAEARADKDKAAGKGDVLAKVEAMPALERAMATVAS